jgi:hypothetical protein
MRRKTEKNKGGRGRGGGSATKKNPNRKKEENAIKTEIKKANKKGKINIKRQ